MTLLKGFLFNQSNLQDFIDCQRRFQLRHMLHLSWPAVDAEPFLEYERMMDQGSRFHKIIRQYLTGIPESQIEQSLGNDEVIKTWWRSFNHSLRNGILDMIFHTGNSHAEETTLSIPVDEFRLVAKYDLLVTQPNGKLLIFDWKTSTNRPKRKWLANRMQTLVYPYVLSGASNSISSLDLAGPSQIEMIYWFANYPEQPERFSYDGSANDVDSKYIEQLISTIKQNTEPIFALTPDVKHCLFCNYRSLCNRGVKPGELHELETWQELGISSEDISLDYEQIGEIEF
jgi:CRISPR/Cas system-associated exonuclease Cas4 (RecB family)